VIVENPWTGLALEGKLFVGEVTVAGDDAGVGDEGQKRNKARS